MSVLDAVWLIPYYWIGVEGLAWLLEERFDWPR